MDRAVSGTYYLAVKGTELSYHNAQFMNTSERCALHRVYRVEFCGMGIELTFFFLHCMKQERSGCC